MTDTVTAAPVAAAATPAVVATVANVVRVAGKDEAKVGGFFHKVGHYVSTVFKALFGRI